MLKRFERRGVALMSVSESLDTGSAAGRLVLNIMTAVSQWALHPRRGSAWRLEHVARIITQAKH